MSKVKLDLRPLSTTELCGCGKPALYMLNNNSHSCNKYQRCLTYQELKAYCDNIQKEKDELVLVIQGLSSVINKYKSN